MYGCFDSFELYRTVGSADAAAALSTAIDGSSPSSVGSSPSSTSSTARPQSHIHPIIIAVAVAVVILLLAAVAGLALWVIILKRRQQTQSRPTELQPVHSTVNGNVGLKTELVAKEISTDLPGPVTETKQSWGTTVLSAEQGQEVWDKPGNQPTVVELPAYQMTKNGYQELPG